MSLTGHVPMTKDDAKKENSRLGRALKDLSVRGTYQCSCGEEIEVDGVCIKCGRSNLFISYDIEQEKGISP